MIELSNFEVFGWQAAIRGMRNPMNSWNNSDTLFGSRTIVIGDSDMKLMESLIKGGSEERKFLRMIVCYMDINAPIYWWKEYDTYKVGTVANSCSTMHKIHSRDLTESDFSTEYLDEYSLLALGNLIERINDVRRIYNEQGKQRKVWYQLIQLLPSCYMQKRTVMVNYEVLRNMYHQRKLHKLDEWKNFCKVIKEQLPYAEELICDD